MAKSVTFVWKATFDLPEGMDSVPSTLDEFPMEFLDEVSPATAELVDWY
jgi:hypothetical protein